MKAGKYQLWLSSPQPFEAWLANIDGRKVGKYKINFWYKKSKSAIRQQAGNGKVY